MIEHDGEPIRGLPGLLPTGEHILWQGAPDWHVLARTAFHTRLVTGCFVALAGLALGFALNGGGWLGVGMTAGLGAAGVGLLHLLAWNAARTTVYTLTNRRIVLRIGMAVPRCINLPLPMIASVDLAAQPRGTGDLPLMLLGAPKLGYFALWPHARPWRVARPQPMLRAVPDAQAVAPLLARTCLAANPAGRITPVEPPSRSVPGLAGAQAA